VKKDELERAASLVFAAVGDAPAVSVEEYSIMKEKKKTAIRWLISEYAVAMESSLFSCCGYRLPSLA
jgi:hypothetical protein